MDEDRIFIVDGPVWTSAGMTAGIDLALAMVEKDLGSEVARAVAKKMVVYHRRAGGQSQFSMLLKLEPKSDRIQSALSYARRNLQTPLSVEQLAEVANLSPRQFSRAFRTETGQSPAKAVENLRVEAARLLMEQGQLPTDTVAGRRDLPTASGCVAHFCAHSGSRRKRSDARPGSPRNRKPSSLPPLRPRHKLLEIDRAIAIRIDLIEADLAFLRGHVFVHVAHEANELAQREPGRRG